MSHPSLIAEPVRVTADGLRYWLALYAEGLTLHVRRDAGRLIAWGELAKLAEGAPPDRHGVVVDGRLLRVFEQEQEAADWAAEHRRLGSESLLIKVPAIV